VELRGGATVATLFVHKAGNRWARLFTLGGEPSRWAVTDVDVELASARTWLTRQDIAIEAGGRHLTLHMPGSGWRNRPRQFAVVDDASGQCVISGQLTHGGVTGGLTSSGLVVEEWAVTLAGGSTIAWHYRQPDPRKLGFFDPTGAPVLQIGHDPSFDMTTPASTLRILLRFWGAAAASADRYVALVEDSAVGRWVSSEDVPVLALVGMWLERTANSRYINSS
jgi:hypothetical protein